MGQQKISRQKQRQRENKRCFKYLKRYMGHNEKTELMSTKKGETEWEGNFLNRSEILKGQNIQNYRKAYLFKNIII